MIKAADIEKGLLHLRESHPRMAKHIEETGPFGLKISKVESIYSSLLESIVYQQLHSRAAETIFGRFRDLYPSPDFPNPKKILKTSEYDLRSVGLSRAKMAAILDLSRQMIAGLVPDVPGAQKLSEEELKERLTQIRGIGPWTVEMLLIFRLGRLDIMPASDYGVRKGFSVLFGKREMPTPRALLAFSDRWRPYRSMAAWYLWRAADREKEKAKAMKEKKAK